jgi:hypothetical protein
MGIQFSSIGAIGMELYLVNVPNSGSKERKNV